MKGWLKLKFRLLLAVVFGFALGVAATLATQVWALDTPWAVLHRGNQWCFRNYTLYPNVYLSNQDNAPTSTGLSGYSVNVTSSNPSVISVEDAHNWLGGLFNIQTIPNGKKFSWVDLAHRIEGDSSSEYAFQLTLSCNGPGFITVTIHPTQVDDDQGGAVNTQDDTFVVTVQ